MQCTPTDFLKIATTTAEHFGFRSSEMLKRDPRCRKCEDPFTHTTASATERKVDALHGLLTSGVNTYYKDKLHAHDGPVLFYNIEPVPRSGEVSISFQIYGVQKSIAEALLIQVTRAVAGDLGFTDHLVRVNSLGDRDSVARYNRELTNFFRKRMNDLPPQARELMKEHVFDVLLHLLETEHELGLRSPSPLEYLSDPSRKHFREIIEFLDMSAAPYEIDPKLLGHFQCYSDAMFSVDTFYDEGDVRTPAPLLIRGGRYDEFVYRNTQRNVPAAGAVVILKDKKAPGRNPRIRFEQPSVYVVQLGFGPKIKSLMVIDSLRRANISVFQNLSSNSLSEQLRDAEQKGVRYTIIIGQKEYVEDAVILRDMHVRNQEQVPISNLANRLRKAAPVVA